MIDSGKVSRAAEITGREFGENSRRIFTVSRAIIRYTDELFFTKGKINFTVERSVGSILIKQSHSASLMTGAAGRTPSLCNALGGWRRGRDLTSAVLLPRMFHPDLITRKLSDTPKWRDMQPDKGAVS